jgi:hypothetical protein
VMSSGQSPNRTSSLPAPRNSPSPRGVLRRRRRRPGPARCTPGADAQHWHSQPRRGRAGPRRRFRVYRDTSELRESLGELGLLS